MGETTAIAWTDHTFNPWIGCTRVSPGCEHCYAEALTKRTGMAVWGKNGTRTVTSDAYWKQPLRWDRIAAEAGRPGLVFCASLADVFEDRPELDEPRERLFDLIEMTPHLIWQLLTKRPENVLDMVPACWHDDFEAALIGSETGACWPSNVWVGTTVEDQQRAAERIPALLAIPAPVRFLSCEPLLSPVHLGSWLHYTCECGTPLPLSGDWHNAGQDYAHVECGRCGRFYVEDEDDDGNYLATYDTRGDTDDRCCPPFTGVEPASIDWVIIGGESGPGHRPLDLRHARSIVEQCAVTTIPVFFKQVGGRTPTAGGDELDGRRIKQFPAEAKR